MVLYVEVTENHLYSLSAWKSLSSLQVFFEVMAVMYVIICWTIQLLEEQAN
jgi:hypothetical protein